MTDTKELNTQSQDNPSEIMQDQCNRYGRRNALTPEAHHIEPIRQTEIQEKMSNLTMASSDSGNSSASSSSNQGGG